MRIKLNVGTTVSRPLPTGETIYLKVRNITLISDDSMPFVHVEFDRWTTNGSVDKVTAVFGEVVQWLNSYSDWRIEESVSFTCPDCQRVTVDPADVVALEADNKRLDEENTHLLSEVAKWKRNFHHADDMLSEATAELDRLKERLRIASTNVDTLEKAYYQQGREIAELRAAKEEKYMSPFA